MSNVEDLMGLTKFTYLDTSTRALGYASWDSGYLVDYGVIKFKKNTTFRRLIAIAEETERLFNLLDTDAVVVETAFFGPNPGTTTSLALVQGAIVGAAALNGIEEFYGVPPVVWQKGIGNNPLTLSEKIDVQEETPDKRPSWYSQRYRQLRKQRTLDIVNEMFGQGISNDDIADAIGLGLYVWKAQNQKLPM